MEQQVNKPHDAFFKARFSRVTTMAEFLTFFLPGAWLGLLDLSRLELEKDSFTDEKLREHFSDLLFKVGLKDSAKTIYIYILLEHKSWPWPWTPLQTARYAVLKWTEAEQQQVKKLPLILGFVLYHGKPKWNVPDNLCEMFEIPEEYAALREFVPQFRYHLCDLSAYTDEELSRGTELPPALLALRHIFSRSVKRLMGGIFQRVASWQASLEEQLTFLETLAVYFVEGGKITQKEVANAVETTFTGSAGRTKIEFIERWRDEGRLEGRQEGWQEGRQEGWQKGRQEALAVLAMLQLKKKLGHLDKAMEAHIKMLTATQLEQLGTDLLDFKTSRDLSKWLRRHAPKQLSTE